MFIKNVKFQSKLLKVSFAACFFAIVAILGFCVCTSNQANADIVSEPNAQAIIITHSDKLTPLADQYNVYYERFWHGSSEESVEDSGNWVKGCNIVTEYCEGHTLASITYYQNSSVNLYFTLTDTNGQIRNIHFNLYGGPTAGFSWKVDGDRVPEAETTITDFETVHIFDFNDAKYFGITGKLLANNTGLPIEGANIICLSKSGVVSKQTSSDDSGKFLLTDISTDDAPGRVIIEANKFLDLTKYFTVQEAEEAAAKEEPLDLGDIVLTYVPNLSIEGGEHHVHFEPVIFMTEDGETTRIVLDPMEKLSDMGFKQGTEYWIDENNQFIIHIKPELTEDVDYVYYIKAVGEDGYVADTWYLNDEVVMPGQVYTSEFINDVFGKVTYKIPQSDVDPEIQQEVNAQTGDSIPLAVVAIIGLSLIATVFGFSRKRFN